MPRTEQEILNDFEEWGWEVVVNDEDERKKVEWSNYSTNDYWELVYKE